MLIERALVHIELMMGGQRVSLARTEPGVYEEVYGTHSGESPQDIDTFVGVFTATGFFPDDDQFSGGLQEGMFYTSYKELQPGDTISLAGDDNKTRRYKVASREGIGTTREVLTRYVLSAMGD